MAIHKEPVWLFCFVVGSFFAGGDLRASERTECARELVSLKATWEPNGLRFELTNETDSVLEVTRGFSDSQRMSLAFVFKFPYGKAIPRTAVGRGDPPVGEYAIGPGQSISELRDPLEEFSDLATLEGPAIMLFSTTLTLYQDGEDEPVDIPACGSLDMTLPLHVQK